MSHLEEITGEALREALWSVEDATAAIRLAAAIIYKQGVDQSEIGEWFGVARRTIYNWLTRLESEPRELSDAARDEDRSGRPSRLTDHQQSQLEETLHDPPTEAGYDAPVWTPALVRRHIKKAFGVEYSLSSCRRWLRKCGMSYKKPRRKNTKTDFNLLCDARYAPCALHLAHAGGTYSEVGRNRLQDTENQRMYLEVIEEAFCLNP